MSSFRSFPAGILAHNELLDRLLGNARQEGFESGYQQAVQDQLEGLVLQAERFLARSGAEQVDKKVLYAFVERLQEGLKDPSLLQVSPFGDGLGI